MGKLYGNRWEIVKSLGQGGQGQTFVVRDTKGEGETLYVLKRLINTNRIERFKREIETVRNLSHPNILRLIDFDLDPEKPFLVTEYCSGGSLDKAEPFWQGDPIRALQLFQQICEGVAHAHNEGIVHRDIKPANIFLRTPNGPPVIGDFGICYIEEDGTRLTFTEEAVGPKFFIAPELEDGRVDQVTTKSDMYSLGKVLYWLLSGGKIFSREKHREEKWDLKGAKKWSGRNASEEFWDNIYMEHINRLLDSMIVHDSQKRLDVNQVLGWTEDVQRLIIKQFNPIAKDIQQVCTYCGYGHYRVHHPSSSQVSNLVNTVIGGGFDWRILICDTCGHIQLFRIDEARRKDWWI